LAYCQAGHNIKTALRDAHCGMPTVGEIRPGKMGTLQLFDGGRGQEFSRLGFNENVHRSLARLGVSTDAGPLLRCYAMRATHPRGK